MKISTASTLLSFFCIAATANASLPAIPDPDNIYTYPAEDTIEHEATWLQWPHNNGWDPNHQQRYETIWIEMTRALHNGEIVRIIAYDANHAAGVRNTLSSAGLNMNNIEIFEYPTDDVWTRDNGPLFVFDNASGEMVIEDWGFNGWVSHNAQHIMVLYQKTY